MFQLFESLPSTNDYCLEYAKTHPGERLVCIASQQTKGRGRQGKSWESPPDNLYLSYLRPMTRSGPLSLLVGLVLAQLLESLGIINVKLKWPNDVLMNDSKIAGILIEGNVIGMGLNLLHSPIEGSGALAEQGIVVDKISFAKNFIDHLEAALVVFEDSGFAPFMSDWSRFDTLADRLILWENGLAHGESRALGVNVEGGLILESSPFVLYSGSVRARKSD